MAGVTLNQIATKIAGEQAEKKDDTSFVAQCEIWLKDAMIEIDSEANFKAFSKSFQIITDPLVVDGLYDLPPDFKSMKYLRHINTDDSIDYENPKSLVTYGVDLEVRGKPSRHWIADPRINANNEFTQRVRLHPIPNSAETLDGMYYFDVLNITSNSVLPLTQQALLAVESRLRMYVTKSDKEWTAYNVERSEYGKNLAGLIRSEVVKPSRSLRAKHRDLGLKNRRPARLRYPFE